MKRSLPVLTVAASAVVTYNFSLIDETIPSTIKKDNTKDESKKIKDNGRHERNQRKFPPFLHSKRTSFCDASQSTTRLSQGNRAPSISSYTYPANDPIEDRFVIPTNAADGVKDWAMTAVFDGHGGWQVAEFASK
jgi:hypothetical protein